MNFVQLLLQHGGGDAAFVGHQDQLHGHQEDASLQEQVMRKTLREQRGHEKDQGNSYHQK